MFDQKKRFTLSLLLASVFAAQPAFAQDDDLDEILNDPGPGESDSGGDTGGGDTTAPASPEAAPAGGDGTQYSRDDFPRIADDEETIFAVQRKAYLVNQKIELTVMGAASFTDRFVQTWAPAVSGTYHLAENFGIEVFGAFMFPNESGLTDEIAELKLRPEIAKLTQMLWAGGLGFQWSPIYGKIEVFGTSLGNFNFYLGAGAGVGQTRVQCVVQREALDPIQFGPGAECGPLENPDDPNPVVYEPNRTQVMSALAGGVRIYFSEMLGLKLEVKDWIFPARVYKPDQQGKDRFTDAIRNNVFIQAGVSFLFGGE